ncbi:hypothetical protein A9Q83_03430 [Alphaproteobacteria bacterium 46_93_T64]|nr:hypothetical protein A9Q83_03430 [Alphaproteobacteria bacterium 46_93_T64]
MRNFDFSPLMRSASLHSPFNSLFDELDRSASESRRLPYNILKKDADHFQIVVAAAGYSEDDIDITVAQNSLSISAESHESDENIEYLHHGLSAGAFTQKFELSDMIKVKGATMDNGLLKVELVREIPESLKPLRIKIEKSDQIEDKAS